MPPRQFSAAGCSKQETATPAPTTTTPTTPTGYTGTGSVSQGKGITTTANLFAAGIRVAALGTVTSTDNKTWTVPADVNYASSSFPMSSDLYNSYVAGHSYAAAAAAVAALSGSNVVTVDNSANDASCIWSSNLLLDNVVLLRKQVQ